MNVDRENGILHDVVLMTTLVNANDDYLFDVDNLRQVKRIGENKKVYCYLGHAKQGITSNDRLPFRLGYFECYRIVDETTLKADLVLSPTVDENPILSARVGGSMAEYIYRLAETEADQCGMSIAVNIFSPKMESVDVEGRRVIVNVDSIDLVEDPALTFSLFSKSEINKDMNTESPNVELEDVDPRLAKAFDLFNELDTKIKEGADAGELVDNLLTELSTIFPKEEEAKVDPEEKAEAPEAPAPEVDPNAEPEGEPSPEEKTEEHKEEADKLDALAAQVSELSSLVTSFISALMGFSKESKKEPAEVGGTLKVVFSRIEEENHVETRDSKLAKYHALRESNPVEAAKYYMTELG